MRITQDMIERAAQVDYETLHASWGRPRAWQQAKSYDRDAYLRNAHNMLRAALKEHGAS